MSSRGTVFVVDDEEVICSTVAGIVEPLGMTARGFPDPAAFLEGYVPARPQCLVLDVRMPGMSGLQLQEKLAERQIDIPIIMLTGHAEVPTAVQALRAGAFDFIEKPFGHQILLDAITKALEEDARTHADSSRRTELQGRLAQLSDNERHVMEAVVAGTINKRIAEDMGVSERSVETYRRNVMAKMQVQSLPELVRIVAEAGIDLEQSE